MSQISLSYQLCLNLDVASGRQDLKIKTKYIWFFGKKPGPRF
jgi:hypothetical protein